MKTTLPISPEPVLAQLTALAAEPELTQQVTTNGDRVDHICDYKILQQDLSRAAKRTLTNLKRGRMYHKVLVLAIYWHKDLTDRPHLAVHAERLLHVFKDKFGYEIDRHILEKDDAYKALNKKLVTLDDQLSSKTEDNLLVLYYGGHGGLDVDDSKARLWFPSLRDAAKSVDWNKLQTQLGESEFDILFLFDCCYAMSMPNRKLNWHKRCEIVGASGAREKAGGRPETSFTSAVAGLLEDDFKKFGETNAWRLGSIMKSLDYNKAMLKSTPDYEALCPGYSTISLVPRDGNSHGTSSVGSNTFHDTLTSSNARIIFSLAMTNVPTAKDFQRMLDVLPPTVTEVKVDVSDQQILKSCGLFQSNSALALLSVPVWFWCAIATNPAYKYISLIRSENLLEQARREAEQQALTLNYCSIGVQTEESNKQSLDEKQGHQTSVNDCIQLMSTSLKRDICGMGAPGVLVSDIASNRVQQCLPPKVKYACLYWIGHIHKSGTQLQDNDYIHQFLQVHLLHWLEALSWMRKTAEGILAISSLYAQISVSLRCNKIDLG
jgi:hypothetical protein